MSCHGCQALEVAKQAVVFEKQLSKKREAHNPDQLNFDLSFAVEHHVYCLVVSLLSCHVLS